MREHRPVTMEKYQDTSKQHSIISVPKYNPFKKAKKDGGRESYAARKRERESGSMEEAKQRAGKW
jgi:hypothetical protein